MTMTDPISDLLTRIRNGQMVKKSKVMCPSSKLKIAILKVLQEEGYIRGFEVTENEKGKQLDIALKYFDGKPVIKEIARVSKPGMRVYSSLKSMPTFKNNMGISILSTSKGVMTSTSALSAKLGGEIICRVY